MFQSAAKEQACDPPVQSCRQFRIARGAGRCGDGRPNGGDCLALEKRQPGATIQASDRNSVPRTVFRLSKPFHQAALPGTELRSDHSASVMWAHCWFIKAAGFIGNAAAYRQHNLARERAQKMMFDTMGAKLG
jgi:hypothetical protein